MRNPITALLLAVLIALGFEGLRRRTAREFPDADRKVAEQHGRERVSRATASLKRGRARAPAGSARRAGDGGHPGNGGPRAADRRGRLARLEQLSRLHDAGTVDDDEFRAEKARILAA